MKIGGSEYPVRSLKRREVKALKEDGFVLMALRRDQVDDLMDRLFALLYTPEQCAALDDVDQADAYGLMKAIMAATTGSDAEAKNS